MPPCVLGARGDTHIQEQVLPSKACHSTWWTRPASWHDLCMFTSVISVLIVFFLKEALEIPIGESLLVSPAPGK